MNNVVDMSKHRKSHADVKSALTEASAVAFSEIVILGRTDDGIMSIRTSGFQDRLRFVGALHDILARLTQWDGI